MVQNKEKPQVCLLSLGNIEISLESTNCNGNIPGFDPSRAALEDKKRRSTGPGSRTVPDFQEMTVAP